MSDGISGESLLQGKIESLKTLGQALIDEIRAFEVTAGAALKAAAADSLRHGSLYDELRHIEMELIRRALKATGGRRSRAALLLGMKATTLNTKTNATRSIPLTRPTCGRLNRRARRATKASQPPRAGRER
jgi:DNA-binding NtrC family response regulator